MGNLAWFLYRGGYPSLLYRWAGMTLVPTTVPSRGASSTTLTAPQPSEPGYSAAQLYVKSRQLLWQVLAALLAAGTAAVDWRAVLSQCRVLTVAAAGWVAPAAGAARRRVLAVVRQVLLEHSKMGLLVETDVSRLWLWLCSAGGVGGVTAASPWRKRPPRGTAGAAAGARRH